MHYSWKLRFLIKVREILDTAYKTPGPAPGNKGDKLASNDERRQSYFYYRRRLNRAITGVFIWALKAHTARPRHHYLESTETSSRPLSPQLHHYGGGSSMRYHESVKWDFLLPRLPFEPRTFHFMTIIALYVLEHGIFDRLDDRHTLITKNHWVWNEYLDYYTPDMVHQDDSAVSVLQYFNALCCQKLQKHIPESTKLANLFTPKQVEDLDRRAKQRARVFPKAEPDEYNTEDEELDRIILLFHEMFPDQASTLKEHTLKRMEQRVSSITLRPGTLKPTRSSLIPLTTSTQEPWESDCLNHQMTLKLAIEGLNDSDIKNSKDLCSKFLTQDFTFLPTHSRNRREGLKLFWSLTASAITCTTLLDLVDKLQGMSVTQIYD